MADFVHLFCCSRYSLLRGTFSTGELAQAAQAAGCRAVALSDWRGLYGAVPFQGHALRAGIRPIFGVSFPTPTAGAALVALARDARGFSNLCRLTTADRLARPKALAAFSEKAQAAGERPRDLLDLALEHSDGVIFLTSDPDWLRALRSRLTPETLYAEYFQADARWARQLLRQIVALAAELGLRGVATNRVHFLAPSDFERHRLVSAIRERQTLDTLSPENHVPPSCSFASPSEMAARFADLPDALRASGEIAERCDVRLPIGGPMRMPHFSPREAFGAQADDGTTCESYLAEVCRESLPQFYAPECQTAARARLEHELDIICSMGYAPYFLVVRDIVQFARRERIPLTGRGSAADSLVSYLLGFTHVDPIAHNLYFERFLNRARSSPPDIDLDLCWRRRDEVVDYVYERWGADRVAMISTHVTLAGRSCVREVGKAMGLSESEMSQITRYLPHYGSLDFERLHRERPESRHLDPETEPLRSILPAARSIEGFPTHLGVHPSGIVVAPGVLSDWVPLERASKGLLVTQYDMHPIEDLGWLKIDLLGQRSLSVIADVDAQVRRERDADFDIEKIDTQGDAPTQDLLAEGRTMGVFQVESPSMRGVLRKVRARDFETVTAASSVIRPGPKDAGMLRSWIRRHTGREPVQYLHRRLAEVLSETHGIMIYQEDVMRVMQAVAGMTLAEADQMRRAMSDKRPEKQMEEMESDFLSGAGRSGLDPIASAEIWRQMRAFAGYAFCKAHSASYTVLSFRSAYLKSHYPAEFMAAVLANGGGFYDRAAYVSEARRMGLELRLPSINRSEKHWTGRDRSVRCGLDQIKGLGRGSIDAILEERAAHGPFSSLANALGRLPQVERSEWDALVACGACDDLFTRPAPSTRPQLLWALDQWFKGGQRPKASGTQLDLFDAPERSAFGEVPDLPEYPEDRLYDEEAGALDLPIRAHPLRRFRSLLPDPIEAGILAARDMASGAGRRARMAGWLVTSRRLRTSKGSYMKFLTLEDETDIYEAILFDKAYQRYGHLTLTRGPYIVEGRIEEDEGHCSLHVDRLELLQIS